MNQEEIELLTIEPICNVKMSFNEFALFMRDRLNTLVPRIIVNRGRGRRQEIDEAGSFHSLGTVTPMGKKDGPITVICEVSTARLYLAKECPHIWRLSLSAKKAARKRWEQMATNATNYPRKVNNYDLAYLMRRLLAQALDRYGVLSADSVQPEKPDKNCLKEWADYTERIFTSLTSKVLYELNGVEWSNKPDSLYRVVQDFVDRNANKYFGDELENVRLANYTLWFKGIGKTILPIEILASVPGRLEHYAEVGGVECQYIAGCIGEVNLSVSDMLLRVDGIDSSLAHRFLSALADHLRAVEQKSRQIAGLVNPSASDPATTTAQPSAAQPLRLAPAATLPEPTPELEDSGHYAHGSEKRREIVANYERARAAGEVENKDAWARTNYGITGRTLKAYQDAIKQRPTEP